MLPPAGYFYEGAAPAVVVSSGDTVDVEMITHHAGGYLSSLWNQIPCRVRGARLESKTGGHLFMHASPSSCNSLI
jgi:hypothetical protein